MKNVLKYTLGIVVTILITGFTVFQSKNNKTFRYQHFSKVEIETLVEDSLLNVRALEYIESYNTLVFLTSKGQLGLVKAETLSGNESAPLSKNSEIVYPIQVSLDSFTPNFRALSARKKHGFGINIGSPAMIYNLNSKSKKNKIVYKETHPKAFYDSMEFWNDDEGIAMGDPTDNCISIIITRDGGETWNKLSCDVLPETKEGEAAFAASDTNIAIVGDHTWIATGGKASRVLYSPDKGKTWALFETPIVQGKETTGMYSIDFYDENLGFAIGGDYTKPDDNAANKIRTFDGGKTWELVAQNKEPGYRSCVQFVPNSVGQELVAIGFKGIDYSNDFGKTWKHLSDESFYTIRFANDSIAYAAGRGRVSKLTFKP